MTQVAKSCNVPFEFHGVAMDGCEVQLEHLRVQPGKALIKLPLTPNIQDICTKYCKYRSQNYVMIFESTTEIMKGLCFYFDKALPVMLLYKSERHQYADAIRDNVSPSMVYGAGR
ncbi:hypothetical protein H0E87_004672 [Populus deltoides]|uniref:MRG domain-containing protein n=1 Tax=Populus deltoides TaxID=3696 RepID=A0A8T2ZFM7_POPDE|nr:hypothetical protein H0E87_004672 [Populus deltoides]